MSERQKRPSYDILTFNTIAYEPHKNKEPNVLYIQLYVLYLITNYATLFINNSCSFFLYRDAFFMEMANII